MTRTVIVRYGELSLKSEPVRREFKEALIENISSVLGAIRNDIYTERGRIFIETSRPEETASRVSKIPGVVSTSPAWKIESSFDKICELSEEVSEKYFSSEGSFAVRPRRTGNHDFSSQDLANEIGERVLESNPSMSVDLDHPDHELGVEVREKDAYIFTEVFDGVGGLPVGTQGEVLVLFSEGVRGLLSSFFMLKRGTTVLPLILKASQDGRDLDKGTLEVLKELKGFHPGLKFLTFPFQDLLDRIPERLSGDISQVFCRRISVSLAGSIASELGAKAVVLDTDLDQMSNRGLKKARLIEGGTELPVLHPLSGFDGNKISEIAGDIFGPVTDGDLDICFKAFPKPGDLDEMELEDIEEDICEDFLAESPLDSMEIHDLEDCQ